MLRFEVYHVPNFHFERFLYRVRIDSPLFHMQNRNKRRGDLVLCLEEVLLMLHENELSNLIQCAPILSTHEQLQMANFDKKAYIFR